MDELKNTLYKIQGIPAIAIERFWPFAIPFIKRALDHTSGELSVADFHRLCLSRDVQLWLITRDERVVGAITTEIVNYPNRKHCRVITLAGTSFTEWLETADTTLQEWAKTQNCNAIESYVRKGLVPKMALHGYKHKHSILIKELPSWEKAAAAKALAP